jgi:hypothetical protein
MAVGDRKKERRRWLNRQRVAMGFALLGTLLMGVDLLLTGNFFVHIGELMAASILCFIIALVLDRTSDRRQEEQP